MDTTPTSPPNYETEQKPIMDLKEKLNNLSLEPHPPTIYKVHNQLRKTNNEAYEPAIVAIGPYHCHNPYLQKMETQKLRYLQRLLQRFDKRIEDCISAMQRFEPEARKCYDGHITLNSTKFTEMLVLDGCFIIEFAFRHDEGRSDYIFDMTWAVLNVKRDLLLFENQVPFFILYELLHFMDVNDSAFSRLVEAVLRIYGEDFTLHPQFNYVRNPTNLKHLLELIHKSLVLPSHESHAMEPLDFIGSATSLDEANVMFQKTDENGSMFQLDFENGSMQMPGLSVTDDTESYFRNLIAYEQYFVKGTERHVGDYAILMDCLMTTPEDVKLLMECQIIENWLGSENEVAKMFNKLCDGVKISAEYFVYKGKFEKVNQHCNRRWNKWIAMLNHNHFNSPWGILSIAAAILLFALTIVQTVFSIIK